MEARQGHSRLVATGLRIPRKTTVIVAAFGLTVDLVIAVSTLLPRAPVFAQWPQFALIPLVFVVHVRTVALVRQRDLSLRRLRGELPVKQRAMYMTALVAFWLAALLSILATRGAPEIHHGAYFLNNHGDLTRVGHAAYEHALILRQRIFTLIPAMFFAAALIANAPPPWGIGRTDAAAG